MIIHLLFLRFSSLIGVPELISAKMNVTNVYWFILLLQPDDGIIHLNMIGI